MYYYFRPCTWIPVLLLVFLAGLLAPSATRSAQFKLNGPLPSHADIRFYWISPDGQYVVYESDQETDEAFALYSVPITGGTPVRLTGALPAGTETRYTTISPDSRHVVYIAPQDTNGVDEIYSVPITGPASAAVKLNRSLVAGGNVTRLTISPDSTRVIYYADQEVDGKSELYSVPIAGPSSAGVKLNRSLVTGGSVNLASVTPDSLRVVYLAEQDTDNVREVYSVPIAGPASAGVKLNPALVAGGTIQLFDISPNGDRVVYYGEQAVDGVVELYSVPIAGPASAAVKLNPPLVTGGDVDDIQISPNSARVVYRADQQTDNVRELYSVPIGGGAAVKLNGSVVTGGQILNFDISPDSTRVMYWGDQQINDTNELYSVPIAGPATAGVKLNGPLVPGGDVHDSYDMISADSSRVVYRADQEVDGKTELYSVPIAGPASASVKLNPPLVSGGSVDAYNLSSDGTRAIYRADQATDGVLNLYSVPIAGPASAAIQLNPPLPPGSSLVGVYSWLIAPGSRHVVYRAPQETVDMIELYVTDLVPSHMVYVPIVQR